MSIPIGTNPATTALLVIECQNGVVGRDSVLPALAEAAAPIFPIINRLAAGARAAGVLVAYLIYLPVLGNRSSNRKPPMQRFVAPQMADWTPGHPAILVVPEIETDERDLVLIRHSGLSPVHGTETFEVLRNIGITTLVLTGVSTNIAIPVSATGAVDEGFDVIVPRDAVAGTPREHHDSMLDNTIRMLATMTTADELLEAWKTSDAP